MSESSTKQWIASHPLTLPLLPETREQLSELLQQQSEHNPQLNELIHAHISLQLPILIAVNQSRDPAQGKQPVNSIQAALSLLGQQQLSQILTDTHDQPYNLTHPDNQFLYQQILNRAAHTATQVENLAEKMGYQSEARLKLAAILNFYGELLVCVHQPDIYLKTQINFKQPGDEQTILGFTFQDLTLAVLSHLHFPEFFIQCASAEHPGGKLTELIWTCALLCRQCEHGWYQQETLELLETLAQLTHDSLDKAIHRCHQNAVIASTNSHYQLAWQPAARLILIKDEHWQPLLLEKKTLNPKKIPHKQKEPEQKTKVSQAAQPAIQVTPDKPRITNSVTDRIKELLTKPGISQPEILQQTMTSLMEIASVDRLALILFSKDRKQLQARMILGDEKTSALARFAIPVQQSGLLKSLLTKPQALRVSDHNFSKYRHLIPKLLLAATHSQEFYMMSLFIGEKPIGLVYADLHSKADKQTQDDFATFKKAILLCSQLLTRQAKKAA